MEAWKMLLSVAGILVLYALLITVTGTPTSAFDIAVAVVFGLGGIYLGRRLNERLFPER